MSSLPRPPVFLSLLLAFAGLLAGPPARAQLVIEITQGVDDPTPLAVVPFAWEGEGTAPEDLAPGDAGGFSAQRAVRSRESRRHAGLSQQRGGDLLSRLARHRQRVRAHRTPAPRGRGFPCTTSSTTCCASRGSPRAISRHRRERPHAGAPGQSDAVYEKLTGIPGAFATRLIYVSVTRNPTGKDYYR
jgi:TolB protein